MTDTERIQEQYRRMYDAMIRKNADALSAVLLTKTDAGRGVHVLKLGGIL